MNGLLLSTALLLSGALAAWVPQAAPSREPPQEKPVPIEEVTVDEDGDGVPDRLGDTVTVAGRALVATGVFDPQLLSVPIADSTGAIQLFADSVPTPLERGDSVVATGVVDHYNGRTELTDLTYRVVGPSEAPLQPRRIDLAEADFEELENRLVQTTGRLFNRSTNQGGRLLHLMAPGESDRSIVVFVSNDHSRKPDLDRYSIGDEVRVRGVLTQYDPEPPYTDNYEILPRSPASLEPVGLTGRQQRVAIYVGGGLLIVSLVWTAVLQVQIRRRKEAQQELSASEERYRTLFADNVAGVFRALPRGEVLECNPAFAGTLRVEDPGELEGLALEELFLDEEDYEEFLSRLESAGTLSDYEETLRTVDGSAVSALMQASLKEDPELGEPVVEATVVDITERKELEAQLTRMAYRDPLTGIANRRALREHAGTGLRMADRNGWKLGLVYLDIDRFRRVNETLGHAAGDQVLQEVADRLDERIRGADTLARIGGDEFAVLLTEAGGVEDAVEGAGRLQGAFDDPHQVDGRDVTLNVRVGVAVYPDHAEEFEDLLAAADHAASRGPDQGGRESRLRLYDPSVDRPGRDVLAEEMALRTALEEDQLRVYYQPVIRFPEGSVAGGEALLRWDHPDEGIVSAGRFIGLAERVGLMGRIDRLVLRRTIRAAASGEAEADWLAVNLSPASLNDASFYDFLDEQLDAAGLDPARLVLEITERVAVRDATSAAGNLRALRDRGVRVAIDDFGTGHSSLAYLERLPADILKIDRLFVSKVGEDPRQERLMEGIIALGGGLEMEVAAEGVEEERQVSWLRSAGCDLAQGYHFGRPAPPGEWSS